MDLVFTGSLFDVENVQFLAPVGKSHHSSLAFEFPIDNDDVDDDGDDDDDDDEVKDTLRYKYCFCKGNHN